MLIIRFLEKLLTHFCHSENYQSHPPVRKQATVTVLTSPMDQQPSADGHQQAS